ncbi:MAG: glycosyltransferase [Magnetococcales bacterium]|nr:glycosyltransferase [Magnetococcales bacterium]NGZ28713.1 glycosyltransferase [Magnetococcales bacterium]
MMHWLQGRGHLCHLYTTSTSKPDWYEHPVEIIHFAPGQLAASLEGKQYDLILGHQLIGAIELHQANPPSHGIYVYTSFDPLLVFSYPVQVLVSLFRAYPRHLANSPVAAALVKAVAPAAEIHTLPGFGHYLAMAPFRQTQQRRPPPWRVGTIIAYPNPVKNLPLLQNTFRELKRRYPAMETVIIHAGLPTMPEADRMIYDPPWEEKLQELASWDLFLHTSHFESIPRAPLEAMAVGVPVVAANSLGISVYTTDQNAIVLDSPSPATLANYAAALLEDPVRWQQMAQAGFNTAQSFDWHHSGPLLENTLWRLIDQQPPEPVEGDLFHYFYHSACFARMMDRSELIIPFCHCALTHSTTSQQVIQSLSLLAHLPPQQHHPLWLALIEVATLPLGEDFFNRWLDAWLQLSPSQRQTTPLKGCFTLLVQALKGMVPALLPHQEEENARLYDAACQAYTARQSQHAEDLCYRLLTHNPCDQDGWHLWSVLAMEQNALTRAEGMFTLALSLGPVRATYLESLAWLYLRQEKWLEAKQTAEQALSSGQNLVEARYALAIACHQCGDLLASLQAFQQAMQSRPNHGEAMFALAKDLCKVGHLVEASTLLAVVLQLNRRHLPALLLQSQLLIHGGQKNQATPLLKLALATAEENLARQPRDTVLPQLLESIRHAMARSEMSGH